VTTRHGAPREVRGYHAEEQRGALKEDLWIVPSTLPDNNLISGQHAKGVDGLSLSHEGAHFARGNKWLSAAS
jgi:hypothetical protein